MSSDDEPIEFTVGCYPYLDGLGRIVHLELENITTCIFHSNDLRRLVEVDRTVSIFTFELALSSEAYIYSVLLQLGIEHIYCEFLAHRIANEAAQQLQQGVQRFLMDVNVRLDNRLHVDEVVEDSPGEDENRGGASEQEMKMLHRVNGGELKSDVECSICLQGLSSSAFGIIKMPCSHLFHESCIFKWLQIKNSCPMCRQVPFADRAILS